MHYALVFSTSRTSATDSAITNAQLQHVAKGVTPLENITWLADGVAAECPINQLKRSDIDALRQKADAFQIDVNMVPKDKRRKSLLIADMDSTIIEGESLDDMAELAGLGSAIAAITTRAMRGELDFEQAIDERVAMLAGRPTTLFEQAIAETTLMPGAITAIQTMRANGAFCYLVSGGFTSIVAPIADQCGFHGFHANEMHIKDNMVTGTVKKPVLGREAKAQFLAHYSTMHGQGADQSLCVGDGANDMAMLKAAGMGVAYQGKPLLREAINIQLNHTNLTGLLFLQGYKSEEFVTSS